MIRSVEIVLNYWVIVFTVLLFMGCEKDDNDNPEEFSVVKYNPVQVEKQSEIKTWMHFMPWFESDASSDNGKWGMHWTMNTMNPEILDEYGKRNIASHFYPLTGPYSSSDPDIIEYQLLLMKYSGIDGILIDWYGSTDVNDYKINRDNSEAVIKALDNVGLDFAIVYEDRTIAEVADNDVLSLQIEAAQEDMIYIEQNYFNNPQYIKINNNPLLLVFGPEVFHNNEDWEQITAAFDSQPCLIVLNGKSNETAPVSSGEYIWVDNSSIDNKYGNMNKFNVYIGGAYPGFLDFYKEGGWGDGFNWSIDYNSGETLKTNLQKAKANNADYIQLITWNDYGEGTMIEPTDQFRFSFLSKIQEFNEVNYDTTDLSMIFDLYNLRKKEVDNKLTQKYLDQAFYYLVSLQSEKAYKLIDSLKIK
jgi:hypothetical protein